MNGDWLLLTQAAAVANFSLTLVKSLRAAINTLTRPLPVLSHSPSQPAPPQLLHNGFHVTWGKKTKPC